MADRARKERPSSSARSGSHGKRARYSAWSLFRHGLTTKDWPLAWRKQDLAGTYDVVIIGGGVHGLATAYYLATNHGIRKVAVLDKGYLGGGGSGLIGSSNIASPL